MTPNDTALAQAQAHDNADVLAAFRARFAMPRDERGAELIYLSGHSLGLMPLSARELLAQELDDWSRLAVLGHEHGRRPWVPYHENLTAGLSTLTGSRAGEVVAMNSLTVNLHLMMASFYRPEGARTKVLMEAGAFSSDRHAVASQIAWHGLDPEAHLIERAPRTVPAVSWASISLTPSVTCRSRCMTAARTSPCGAATSI